MEQQEAQAMLMTKTVLVRRRATPYGKVRLYEVTVSLMTGLELSVVEVKGYNSKGAR